MTLKEFLQVAEIWKEDPATLNYDIFYAPSVNRRHDIRSMSVEIKQAEENLSKTTMAGDCYILIS